MKFGLAVLASAAAVASASKVEICSDSVNNFGIKDVKLPPFVVAGEKMQVEFTQEPNQYVGKGKVQVELDVEGVPVASDHHQLCKATTCSIPAHSESKSKVSVHVPEHTPGGFTTTLKIVVNGHDGKLLSCVTVSGVKIKKDTKKSEMLRVSAGPKEELSLSGKELDFLFKRWAEEFGMVFEKSEIIKRMKTFAENLQRIAEHNLGDHTYSMKMNQFGHLSGEEFKQQYLGFKGGENKPSLLNSRDSFDVDESKLTDLPAEVDWTKKGAVTPVKNQGSCGSCWSFSTTGALEGAYFIKYGKLVSFSEQELVSCDKVDQGCNGGLMDNADAWIEKNGGLCTEEDYPYVSGTGMSRSCQESKCKSVPNSAPQKFVDVAHNEAALEAAIAQQPVSIAIEADQAAFQFFSKGVLTGRCGAQLDHGVLAVGYGTLDGVKYYKVKNSWGPTWGEAGYVLIERGKEVRGGQCGILLSASYPVL